MKDLQKLKERIEKAEEEKKGFHIFSCERRRKIFEELTKLPCRTSSSLSRITGIEVRSVIWHLEKLRRGGFVDVVKEGKKYYIVPGLIYLEDVPFFSLLSLKNVKKLLKIIWGGCVPISEINMRKSTLYRIVNHLKSMDMVELGGERRKLLCPTEKLGEMAEKYDKIGRDFKRDFLKKIESRGFEIKVIGTVNYKLKLRVTGMDNFNMSIYISPVRTALEVL